MTKKQKIQIVKSPPRQRALTTPKNFSIEKLITTAIKEGVPVETMERVLAMRKELKAEQAKEAFDIAMAKFQSECPIIKKSREGGKTKAGQVAYYYAPLDSIVSQVRPFISKNGFSYSIQTKTLEKSVKAICTAKHILGHSETSDMTVPLGGGTNIMSAPQITASALSFAKRYAFCNAFGIMTGDDDNDANIKGTTPPAKTPAKVNPPTLKDTMDMIRNGINQATESGQVIDIDTKTQSSKKFNKTFKAEISKLANAKVNELDNKK